MCLCCWCVNPDANHIHYSRFCHCVIFTNSILNIETNKPFYIQHFSSKFLDIKQEVNRDDTITNKVYSSEENKSEWVKMKMLCNFIPCGSSMEEICTYIEYTFLIFFYIFFLGCVCDCFWIKIDCKRRVVTVVLYGKE